MLERTRRQSETPCALAIGGLDPGGGAGILADLRAFRRAGVYGCAASAVTTVQSVAGLRSVTPMPSSLLAAQVTEVLDHQRVQAIKVGALGARANVLAIARVLARHPGIPVVVDTPVLPTRGAARLLERGGVKALVERLLPLATLVTVNVDEAALLLGEGPMVGRDLAAAAERLRGGGARAVLIKGGHLRGPRATDILALEGRSIEISAPRLSTGAVHGTGCTFAALVAGRLAGTRGLPDAARLTAAVRWAKRAHHAALRRPYAVDEQGAHRVAGRGRGMRVLFL